MNIYAQYVRSKKGNVLMKHDNQEKSLVRVILAYQLLQMREKEKTIGRKVDFYNLLLNKPTFPNSIMFC